MKRDRQPRAHHTPDRSAVQPHPLTLRVRTNVADVPARCRHPRARAPGPCCASPRARVDDTRH